MVVGYLMKEMALIQLVDWKDEPILAKSHIQLLYYVCGICYSMRVELRCD